MRNTGWTSGQYSFYRATFGGYLFVHYCSLVAWAPELFSRNGVLPNVWDSPLAALFPNVLTLWDSSGIVRLLLIVAAGLSILFVIGLYDRAAALALWYVGTCLFDRNPLIANPALPYIGWLLLAHAFLPAASYGSVSSRGDFEDGHRWRMQPDIYAVGWILLALGYTYSGLCKLGSPSWIDGTAIARILASPLARPGLLNEAMLHLPVGILKGITWGTLGLEITFVPLSFFRRTRPWIWAAMSAVHIALLLLIAFPDLTVGMLMMHLFTFDPAWIAGIPATASESIFYDGECGLCNWAVRLVMAEDSSRSKFRFAPLGSEAFELLIPAAQRASLPDSLVVRTADGRVVAQSTAVVHILGRLGGVWTCLGYVLARVPSPVRDAAYDFVARNRFRLFPSRYSICPVLPPEMQIPNRALG